MLANLRRLGVGMAQLEDAAQDVFVVAYRRLGDFEGRSSERTWLYGIARRIAHRYRRTLDRSTRRRQRLARASTSNAVDVEHEVDRRRAGQLLHVFLDTLPSDQRDAFILGELEQLGRQEVGAALGISPNTAYSRLRLARERLTRTFDDSQTRHELIMRWREPPRANPQQRRRVMALVMARIPGMGTTAAIGSSSISAWAVAGAVTLGAIGVMLAVRSQLPEPAISADRGERSTSGRERREEPANSVPSNDERAVAAPRHEPPPTEPVTVSAAHERPNSPKRSNPAAASRESSSRAPSDERASDRDPALPSTSATPADLAAQLSVLREAREALATGEASKALRLLRAHAERFPQSAFVLDRRVLEIEALCLSGRLDAGRKAQRRFLAEHGSSPQAARVRDFCTSS